MPLPLCSLLSMLADKLNMTPEEAERWIVNLIRNARLDAKIDSKLVRLYMRRSSLGVMSFKPLCISLCLSQKTEASIKKSHSKILTVFFFKCAFLNLSFRVTWWWATTQCHRISKWSRRRRACLSAVRCWQWTSRRKWPTAAEMR